MRLLCIVSAALLLVSLPGSASGTSRRVLSLRGLKVLDERSSCVVEREQYSFKPRDGGNWAQKHTGLDTCFDKCGGVYEVIVHNSRTDSCYCWREQDGKLEYTGGNDNVYELSACHNTRTGSDDDDDDSSSSSRGGGTTRAGDDEVDLAKCTRKYEQYSYKPRNGGNWERKYPDLDECLERCQDYEVIVHNRRTDQCYCWREEDGDFERTNGNDDTYYIGNCYSGGSTRDGGSEVPPVGWTFGVDEVEFCIEEESDAWTIFADYACTGDAHFTVRPGYLVRETDPYDDDDSDVLDQWFYDGGVEMCQTMFSLDYWSALLDADVEVGSGSWYTYDGETGECRLYTDNDACDRLRYVGANSDTHSGRYCNFWSRR